MFYIDAFLKNLEYKHLSKKTVKSYHFIIKAFKNYFLQLKKINVKKLCKNEVLEYFNLIKKRKVSDAYYHRIVSSVVKYFSYLEETRIIFLNPLEDYPLPKCATILYPSLTQDEIEFILANIRIDKNICIKGKAIIELAYSSALRPREIYNLKITDIDFNKGLLFIEQSKNRKDRIVTVGKQALYWTLKYIKQVRPKYSKRKSCNYVFINHKTGEKLTVYGIRHAVQQTLRLSNLEPIKPHSLRVTAATVLYLNGMSIAHLSKLLGHTLIKTTQRYVRFKIVELQKVLDKKHPRLKLKNNKRR